MTTIIGIDPGKSGGIAILNTENNVVLAEKMPATLGDLDHILNHQGFYDSLVFVEKVNPGPKMGSSAAFKFGHGCGALAMALIAGEKHHEYVTPQKWQKEFGLIVTGRGLGQDDTAKKNRNKARAQELFPGIKITHAIADALLIAEYGRRTLAARKLSAPGCCDVTT